MNAQELGEALEAIGLQPKLDEPLASNGFWRIGGPADAFATVDSLGQLKRVMALKVPVTVVGNGSNLLVADAGIRGVAVKLKGDLLQSELLPGPIVRCGGGLMNTSLLRRLEQAGLGGLGCLAGVPGTVGGAVVMNAGTHLGELGPRVIDVEIVLPGGESATLSGDELGFAYRRATGLPAGAVVAAARLRLLEGEAAAAEQQAVRAHLERRKATQPLDKPSCGSVFKNPPGDYAGRLIEAAGLKGRQQGGAQISEKHANFIINTGGAAAEDVYALIRAARQAVFDRFGVILEPEVHAVGAWPAGAWPLPPLER